MATRYLQKYDSHAQFRGITPELPNAFPIGVVNGAVTFGEATDNLLFNTADLTGNTIRLNSQTDSTSTSGDLIGFQSKPRSGISGSQNIYGTQISAQLSDGVALSGSGSVKGALIDVFLRGTSAGTIAGNVSVLDLELVTDDAGTRNITGYVTALRIRKVFSAGTVTGIQSAIRFEKPEAQTNSETYDGVFDFTSTSSLLWHDTDNGSGDTEAGYFAVYINGNKRYVVTYSDAPSV